MIMLSHESGQDSYDQYAYESYESVICHIVSDNRFSLDQLQVISYKLED